MDDNSFVDRLFEKMREIPRYERNRRLRDTIIEFLPLNTESLLDFVVDQSWLGVEVEAYGVSVLDVLKWAFVEALEEIYDREFTIDIEQMKADLEDAGYTLQYVDNWNYLSIKGHDGESIYYGKGDGERHDALIEFAWNKLVKGMETDAEPSDS